MVAYYTIAGRQVGSHVLAMATLGTTFVGAYFGMKGADKPKTTTPPINATSKDEEDFIKEFMDSANKAETKGKANA